MRWKQVVCQVGAVVITAALTVQTGHCQSRMPAPHPQLILQIGHPESASIVGFTHGGKELITSGGDGFRFWRTSDGALLRVLPVSGGRLADASLSADKSLLFYRITQVDRNDHLWTNLRLVKTETGSLLGSRTVEWTPYSFPAFVSGRPVVVIDGANDVTVMPFIGSPVRLVLTGYLKPTVHILQDGRTIAIAYEKHDDAPGKLQFWQPFGNESVEELPTGGRNVICLALHPTEPVFAIGDESGTITELDRKTGKEIAEYHSDLGQSHPLNYTSDGRYLISMGRSPELNLGEVWERSSHTRVSTIRRPPDDVFSITMSPNGKSCAAIGSVHNDLLSKVTLWSLPEGKFLREFTVGSNDNWNAACSVSSKTLVGSHPWSLLSVWDTQQATLRDTIAARVRGIVTSNSRYIVEYLNEQPVTVFDVMKRQIIWRTPDNEVIFGEPDLSPNGKQMAVAVASRFGVGTGEVPRSQVRIYDIGSSKVIKAVGPAAGNTIITAKYTPSGRHLVIASVYQSTYVYDTKDWKLVRVIPRPLKESHGVPYSHDIAASDTVIALKTSSVDLNVWNSITGKLFWHKRSDTISRSHVFLDHSSQHVILAGEFGYLVYRVSDGRELKPDMREVRRTVELAVGSNRRLGIVSGKDGSITYRDNDTGKTLVSMFVLPPKEEGKAPTDWIAYTPDGYFQGSKGVEKYIRWRVSKEVLPGSAFEKRFRRPDVVVGRLARYLR